MHESYFFGSGNRQLFASYHPPMKADQGILTVFCPPLFGEYTRTHQALRELAITVAESGQHVFRFDYWGTGDSFGNLEEINCSNWIEDIAFAVKEGQEVSGCNILRILGVRAGALLACKSLEAISGIQRMVLWDPIIDSVKYLQQLRHIKETSLKQNINLSYVERNKLMHKNEYGGGYRLSESMVEEFCSLNTNVYSNVSTDEMHVIITQPSEDFPVRSAIQELVKYPCEWEIIAEDLIFAQPVLEKLASCLTKY